MTSDAESGKGRGGLLGSIGRLFGGGRRDAANKREWVPKRASGDMSPEPAETTRWSAPASAVADDDEEDALVLGPSLKAPGDEETGGGRAASSTADEAASELTLVTDTPTASGEAGDASGSDVLAEGDRDAPDDMADESTDDMPEAEGFLARLRAARGEGETRDEESGDGGATGRDQPVDDDREEDRREEDLSEEDALVARMRAFGADQWTGSDGSDENDETPPEDGAADDAAAAEAAPMPQEGHISGFSWLSGEEREDGEGTTPASDAGPEGRETTEAEEMGRKHETETEEDGSSPEAGAPGALLFPGAPGAAGEDEREDEATSDESDGAEESLEGPMARLADVSAGDDTTTDGATTEESGDDDAGADERPDAALAEDAAFDSGRDEAPEDEGDSEPGDESETDPDTVEAEVVAALAAAPAEPGGEAAEGAGVDAAELEDSVRRLIREELEGELGERLSRNIRRMIREEVAHALLRNR